MVLKELLTDNLAYQHAVQWRTKEEEVPKKPLKANEQHLKVEAILKRLSYAK